MSERSVKACINNVAGDIIREINEIDTLEGETIEEVYTITANCSELLTIVCC